MGRVGPKHEVEMWLGRRLVPILKQQMGVVLLPAAAVPSLGEGAVKLVGLFPEPTSGVVFAGLFFGFSGFLCLGNSSAGLQEIPESVIVALHLIEQPLPRALPQDKLHAVQLVVPGRTESLEHFL